MSTPAPSSADLSRVFDLAAEYHAAVAAGVTPDLNELCRESPHLLDAVQSVLRIGLQVSDARHAPEPPLPAGRALLPDRYELGDKIGEGGMGVVYAGRDTSLERDVAVKLLRPDRPVTASVARRFTDEAKVTAQLQHPGIPAVHELGCLSDGRPFLAMKLIRGRTLAALLKERGHGSGKWLGVFEAIGQAVGAAHAAGVIHRDLKPANVMVGAFGEVQVMDWGLAKRIGSADPPSRVKPPDTRDEHPDPSADPHSTVVTPQSEDTDRTNPYSPAAETDEDSTKAGTVLGTPAYMAPEQARGEVDQFDRRTDVYALGAILCELLTGQPPLTGPVAAVVAAAAAGDLADAHARLDGCREDAGLVALCKRCLSGHPADRPPDASEVAVAVASFRSESEARAKRAEVARAEATVQAAEQRKRQRVLLWSGGIALALLLAGVVGTTVGLVFAEGRRVEADQARQGEKERADEAERAKEAEQRAKGEERSAKESALKDRDKQEKAYTKTAEVLDAMVSEVTGASLATQKAITPEQRKFLSEVLGYYREFAAAGDDASTRRRAAHAAFRVSQIENRLGRAEEASAAVRAARDEFAKLASEYPTVAEYRNDLAHCQNNFGLHLHELGKHAAAVEEHRRGVEIYEALVAEYPADRRYRSCLGGSRMNLGSSLERLGKWAEAEAEIRRGVALLDEQAGDQHVAAGDLADRAKGHLNLAEFLERLGKLTAAEEEYRLGLKLLERHATDFPTAPSHRRDLAVGRMTLSLTLAKLGKFSQVEEQYRSGLAIQAKLAADFPVMPDYRRDLAAAHTNFGMLLRGMGKVAAAEEEYRRGLTTLAKLVTDYPSVVTFRRDLAAAHTNLGGVLAESGNRVEAAAVFRSGLAVNEKLVEEHPDVPEYRSSLAAAHTNLGLLLFRDGKRKDAEERCRSGVALLEQLTADFPAVSRYRVDLGQGYCNLGLLVRDGGQAAESLEWYGKAIDLLRPVHEDEPLNAGARQLLRNSHWGRARAYDQLGRFADAVGEWDWAIRLSPPPEQLQHRAKRALSRQNNGQTADAVVEVAELGQRPGWPADFLYDFARVYAVASDKIVDEKKNYADRAMEQLNKAVKAGFKDTARLKDDKDLDPLRGRDDFRALLFDLEKKFPAKREVLPPPRADR